MIKQNKIFAREFSLALKYKFDNTIVYSHANLISPYNLNANKYSHANIFYLKAYQKHIPE